MTLNVAPQYVIHCAQLIKGIIYIYHSYDLFQACKSEHMNKKIEFFNNSDAILNFEHIAMHFDIQGNSTVLNRCKYNIWKRTVILIIAHNRQMLGKANKTKKTLGK